MASKDDGLQSGICSDYRKMYINDPTINSEPHRPIIRKKARSQLTSRSTRHSKATGEGILKRLGTKPDSICFRPPRCRSRASD